MELDSSLLKINSNLFSTWRSEHSSNSIVDHAGTNNLLMANKDDQCKVDLYTWN
jgi:hypothetical protein